MERWLGFQPSENTRLWVQAATMFSFTHIIKIVENLVKAKPYSLQFPHALYILSLTPVISYSSLSMAHSLMKSRLQSALSPWVLEFVDPELEHPQILVFVGGSWNQSPSNTEGYLYFKKLSWLKISISNDNKKYGRRTTYTQEELCSSGDISLLDMWPEPFLCHCTADRKWKQ